MSGIKFALGVGLSLALILFTVADYIFGAILFLTVIIVATSKSQNKEILFLLFITLFFFKNILASLFINYASPETSRQSLTVIQGFDFLSGIAVIICFTLFSSKYQAAPQKRIILFLTIIFAMYLLGISKNGFAAATVNLRMLIYPILLYWVGVLISNNRPRFSYIFFLFKSFGLIALVMLVFEILYPVSVYETSGAALYMSMKLDLPNVISASELLERNTRAFFNFELFKDIEALRPLGILLHPISLGYLLCLISLLSIADRKYILAVIFLLGMLVMGSKGPAIAWSLSILYLVVWRFLSRRLFILTLIITLSAYVFYSYYFGLTIGNPHMVKLQWAIMQIPNVLLGNGIGSSGVFAASAEEDEFGFSDTGLGAIIGQIGILAAAFYLFYFSIIIPRFNTLDRREFMTASYAAIVLSNSFFQEEGLSPYSLGVSLLFLGTLKDKFHDEKKTNLTSGSK